MASLNVSGVIKSAGGDLNSQNIATEDDIKNIGQQVTQLLVTDGGTGTWTISDISNYRYLFFTAYRSSQWRAFYYIPVWFIKQHLGEELCWEMWDGSRCRFQFNSVTEFKVNAEYYAGDIYIHGVN